MPGKATPASGLWLSRLRIGLKIFLKHLLAPVGLVGPRRDGVRVLFYHRVNAHDFGALGLVSREITVPADAFAWQMAHLARHGYRTITLDECRAMLAGDAPMDPKAVLLTFDDGYRDNLAEAAPVLAEHGFTATVFPVLERIGGDNSVWPMSDPAGLGEFMDAAQLRDWLAAGHQIGSHTATHPVLTALADRTLAQELATSRAGLERMLGQPCTSLAYPGGDVDARVAAAARAAGYDLCFTTRSGINPAGADTALLRRTEVSVSDTRLIFALKIRGYFDWTGVRDTGLYRSAIRALNRGVGRLARAPRAAAP